MKLWDKGVVVDQLIEKFTVGNDRELDVKLAKYDVLGSIAHAKMLVSIGIISNKECRDLVRELELILLEIEEGNFLIEDSFEDVHSKIEFILIERLGDTGKKIHTARSRNDQVMLDLSLFTKTELQGLKAQIDSLIKKLIEQSEQTKDVLMPGYTHMQIAMPSSFGMWLAGYAEILIDDIYILDAAIKVADQNPLGSAAGYGSSFPVDREMTTTLLGFEQLKINSIAGQLGRGKMEKSASFAIASLAATISKFAMDIVLFMNQNFGFVTFPDHFTTGSSIMPHKNNPDVFELVRAKCNKLQALPMEITLITNNLPSGYHRDFQTLKESYIPAFETLKTCIELTSHMVGHLEIKANILEDEKYKYVFSVDELNKKVIAGMPFRDAYRDMARQIASNEFNPDHKIAHTHIGSIGNLRNDLILVKLRTTTLQ